MTLIGEAVFARCLSALIDERVAASKVLAGPDTEFTGDRNELVNDIEQALYASKIVSYAQGFQLMRAVSESAIEIAQASWRRVVATAATLGIPIPAISAALAYYDGYRTDRLPANLLQAQRDYFGAHTYERLDRPRGEFFHTNWTGRGGTTSSTTYSA